MEFTYKHTKLACYTSYFTQAIGNCFVPLLFVVFQEEFGLSYEKLGTLIMANFLTQLLVDMFASKYADKIGYRRSLIMANLFSFTGFASLGVFTRLFPSAYTGLVISVMIYAVGGGFLEVLVSPVIDSIPKAEERRAMEMSMLHAIFCWSQLVVIVGTTLFLWRAGNGNWRWIAWIWSLVPLFNILMFTKVPLMPTVREEDRIKPGVLLKNPVFLIGLAAMMCAGASELIMAQWASLFAEKGLGLSKVMGDIVGAGMFAVTMGLGRTLYGIFGEKIALKKVMMAGAVGCIVCYFLAAIPDNSILNVAACAMVGFFVSTAWPGVISMTARTFPMGGVFMFGILAMFGDMGGAFGPWAAGVLADGMGGSLKAGILSGVAFPLILLAALFFYKEGGRNGQNQKKKNPGEGG